MPEPPVEAQDLQVIKLGTKELHIKIELATTKEDKRKMLVGDLEDLDENVRKAITADSLRTEVILAVQKVMKNCKLPRMIKVEVSVNP